MVNTRTGSGVDRPGRKRSRSKSSTRAHVRSTSVSSSRPHGRSRSRSHDQYAATEPPASQAGSNGTSSGSSVTEASSIPAGLNTGPGPSSSNFTPTEAQAAHPMFSVPGSWHMYSRTAPISNPPGWPPAQGMAPDTTLNATQNPFMWPTPPLPWMAPPPWFAWPNAMPYQASQNQVQDQPANTRQSTTADAQQPTPAMQNTSSSAGTTGGNNTVPPPRLFNATPPTMVTPLGESSAPIMHAVSPLAMHVPKHLKEKILSHEFIDLRLLLEKHERAKCMQVEIDPNKGTLMCSQPEPTHKFLNIEKWTSAFMIFMYVYLEQFGKDNPSKPLELLQYMETIRFAANTYSGSGWFLYDEATRKCWSSPKQNFANMNGEYWLRFMAGGGKAQSSRTSSSTSTGAPLCFHFNKGRCIKPRCTYTHRCSSCNSPQHGASQSHLCHVNQAPPQPGPSITNQHKPNQQPFRATNGFGKNPSKRT